MIDALRIIVAKSPYAAQEAMKCIQSIKAKSPMVHNRYNRAVEMAFSDHQANFSPDERELIASFIEGGTGSNRSMTVRFRVTTEENEDLIARAAADDVGVSEYIRSLLWPD